MRPRKILLSVDVSCRGRSPEVVLDQLPRSLLKMPRRIQSHCRTGNELSETGKRDTLPPNGRTQIHQSAWIVSLRAESRAVLPLRSAPSTILRLNPDHSYRAISSDYCVASRCFWRRYEIASGSSRQPQSNSGCITSRTSRIFSCTDSWNRNAAVDHLILAGL